MRVESDNKERVPRKVVIAVTAVTRGRLGPLGNHGGHRRCGRVGAAIGTIGAFRSQRKGGVGSGSILEAREDQRSMAIAIPLSPAPSPSRKHSLPPRLPEERFALLCLGDRGDRGFFFEGVYPS